MPILFQISIEVNSGSVGRIAEQIGRVVMSHGWESYITYARNCLPSESKTVKIGTKWDVYWHGLITRLFDRHCLSSTRATKKLIRQIDQIKPDIIQLHHIHGYYIDMRVLFKYLSSIRTPVVWIFHDCWSITGHCAHFDFVNCSLWKTECKDCIQKTEYPASLFLDRSKKNFKLKKDLFNSVGNMTIVSVSNWLKDLICQSYLSEHQVVTIYNGIDVEMFSLQSDFLDIKKNLGVVDEVILLGVASTWEQRKGLNDFIKLNSIIPDNWRIVLVGLTEQQIKRLPKKMIGVRRTESIKQLAVLYSLATVFVNPTWEDTFPTTNLEALACGTPVITYKTGGSIESVSDDTGFIVEKGDINAIVKCVNDLLVNGKGAYSSACRARVMKYYNNKQQFEYYINLYNKLINK